MSIVIPLPLLKCIQYVNEYAALVTVRHSTGFPTISLMKWSSQASKLVLAIQHVGSTPTMCIFSKCTRGKTRKGGIGFLYVLTAQLMVTRIPRSVDVTCPTCFTPVSAITFQGLCTVLSPVSSHYKLMWVQIHNEP